MAVRNRGLAPLSLLALFAGLATLHLWPMPSDPVHLTRLDNNDTAFNTWVIAWVAHQLAADPLHLFSAPIFYPAANALAFSEHLLVQGAMSAPLQWAGVSPVTAFNVMVWLGYALSGFAMASVMRAWTGSGAAGAVAGSLYVFNAHLLTRYAHLQALHLEFFPVVLYAFDRLLRDARGRDAVLFAVTFVLQALCSYYTMVMMTAALASAFLVRPESWRRARVWILLSSAAVLAAVVLLPFLLPYYHVRQEQSLGRSLDDVRHYSAGWRDYLATAGRLHYEAWSYRFFEGRTPLFPGVIGFALTLFAVVTGLAWREPRARMACAFAVVGVVLSLGDSLPGYGWLLEHLTVLQAIRAVSRWGLLFLIGVSILAGFAVAAMQARWHRHRWWRFAAPLILVAITIEAARAPLELQRFDGLPVVNRRIAAENIAALVVFPLYGGVEFNQNARYMLDQTLHWKRMLNGYSSFAPPLFYELATTLQSFPDARAMQTLRAYRFSHVLLHRAPLERDYGAAALDALRRHPDLELVFEEDGVILYRIR